MGAVGRRQDRLALPLRMGSVGSDCTRRYSHTTVSPCWPGGARFTLQRLTRVSGQVSNAGCHQPQ